MINNRICILGSGAYATALGLLLSKNNNTIFIWGIDQKELNDINSGYNKKYFGDRKFSSSLSATDDLRVAIGNSKYIILATPSSTIDEVLSKLKNNVSKKSNLVLINVSKGLDKESGDILSKKIKKILKGYNIKVVSICGPSFAEEVFLEKPTMINGSSSSKKALNDVCKLFDSNFFKIIPIYDEIGLQVYSALKNLLAIGMGIARELFSSIDTEAALLTIAIEEMSIIGRSMGAKRKTVTDFCSLGDVFLTCSSTMSRNFSFGISVAKNGIEKTLSSNSKTVEGYSVSELIAGIINKKKINAPFFTNIINVLSNKIDPKNIIEDIWKIVSDTKTKKYNSKLNFSFFKFFK